MTTATKYPSWNTYEGHGQPAKGYYWGNDSAAPRAPREGQEHSIVNEGEVIVISFVASAGKVTMPRWSSSFWWSSEPPNNFWMDELEARTRRYLDDQAQTVTDDPVGFAATRRENLPENHDKFRHPMQGKPNGKESEYAWLLHGPLIARRIGPGNRALVYNARASKAAILREEERQITDGPMVHVITVNGLIFQWGMDSNKIMHILDEAAEPRRAEAIIWPEEAGATRAPGQSEDNFVITLECGHETDLNFDPGLRTMFICVQCGGPKKRVVLREMERHPYSSFTKYVQKLTCGHFAELEKRSEISDRIMCNECNIVRPLSSI